MNYINNITEAIGNTPLLKLNKVGKEVGANVFVKLEHLNPSGSYKDRMALAMVEAAERGDTWNGRKVSEGGTIVEASAGNTAPAVALVCAAKGYKSKIYLYRYQIEGGKNTRVLITQAYGPEVSISSEPKVYLTPEQIDYFAKSTPDLLDVLAAKMDCEMIERNNENTVWVDQIYNNFNYIGQKSLGNEIYEQLDGRIDAFGCSVGSGASLLGACLAFADHGLRPETVFGVVPHGSEVYLSMDKDISDRSEFRFSDNTRELAQTIGLDKWVTEKSIVQQMIEAGYPDTFYRVTSEEARAMANRLCQEEGIYCGMSSGANVAVALKIAAKLGKGKNVVTTIVDRRDRYLSEVPHEKYVV
ncbi:MAG: cysteine synthase family protein [Oscillospiraceae bacterium]|nr:cysteine synthase family protein [Oscillospiraceae bacterium]